MTHDPSLFVKRIRHLSQALMISGALNIGVLSLMLYWLLRERPPTPYCELKPASYEQQQIPLADHRGCSEVINQLSLLSLSQLVNKLTHVQLVENGYTERDLALACLITFHHFDIQRALPKDNQPQQKRLLLWKAGPQKRQMTLTVYPNLSQKQFEALIQFARTERWPLTSEGLFLLLKKQKQGGSLDSHLVETFRMTPEFWTVELLFNRSGQQVSKQELLIVLLEGEWNILRQFVDQQRQLHDQSNARRQKFLIDYLQVGSQSAALLMLKTEWEFSVKKLDDRQVLMILKLMPASLPESERFAKEMLISPRGTNVWKQAARWLYARAGESMPQEWNYQAVVGRFSPDKLAEVNSMVSNSSSDLNSSFQFTSKPIPTISSKEEPVSFNLTSPKQQTPPVVNAKMNPSTIASSNVQKSERETKPLLPKPRFQLYIVQKGDSLWKISRRFGVNIETLKAYNELQSDDIKPGITLKIPL